MRNIEVFGTILNRGTGPPVKKCVRQASPRCCTIAAWPTVGYVHKETKRSLRRQSSDRKVTTYLVGRGSAICGRCRSRCGTVANVAAVALRIPCHMVHTQRVARFGAKPGLYGDGRADGNLLRCSKKKSFGVRVELLVWKHGVVGEHLTHCCRHYRPTAPPDP